MNADANAERFPPGLELTDKYVVERVLGAGGMGVVLAVKHRELGSLFAMKLMLPEVGLHADSRERFAREAKAAAQLKSENVARVFDYGFLPDDSPYMVLELLEGQNLAERLAASGPLPAPLIAEYMLAACDALAEAHALGIVHRDLKPSNMFVTNQLVKVLDFGIAKTEGALDDLTKTATAMGSPHYMSPEQMRSTKNVDKRSDIWSLGATMFELRTGRVPFPGDSATEVAFAVMENPVPDLSELAPETPAEFARIVSRCLCKLPQDRYPDIPTLARDLAAVAGEHASTAADETRASAPSSDALASAPTVIDDEKPLTQVFPETELGGAGLTEPEKPPILVPPAPAPNSNRKTRSALYGGIAAVLLGLVVGAAWLGLRPGRAPAPAHSGDVAEPTPPKANEFSGKRVLERRGLNSTVEVTVWLSKDLPKAREFEDAITKLLEGYKTVTHGRLQFSVKDASVDTLNTLKTKGFIVGPLTADGKASQEIGTPGVSGVEIHMGTEETEIFRLFPGDTGPLDYQLTRELVTLADKAEKVERRFGLIAKKSVFSLNAPVLGPGDDPDFNLVHIVGEHFPEYKFVEFDLAAADSAIPADLVGLIITQPATDYTDKELRRIDEFVMRGNKTLIVYASALNVAPYDPKMQGTLSTHNLDKLLAGYGVELVPAAVWDTEEGTFTLKTSVGVLQSPAVLVVDREKDPSHASPVLGLTEQPLLPMPFASPLIIHEDRQPAAEFTVLASSTTKAGLNHGPTLDLRYGASPATVEPPFGAHAVAVLVNGVRQSAFKDVSDSSELAVPKPLSESFSRVLVFSSSEFLQNPYVYSGKAAPQDTLAIMGMPADDRELMTVAKAYAEAHFRAQIFSFITTLHWATLRQLEQGTSP
ncbi:MAG: protein kinase [Polyangiaceae bacterium]